MSSLMLFAQNAGSGTDFTAVGILVTVLLAMSGGGYILLRDTKKSLSTQIGETKQEVTAAEKRLNTRIDETKQEVTAAEKRLNTRIAAVETGLNTRIGETRESLSVQMRELNQQTSQTPQEGTFGNDKNLQELANKLARHLHEYDRIYAHPHTHYVYLMLRDEIVELTEGGRLETRYIPPEPDPEDPHD